MPTTLAFESCNGILLISNHLSLPLIVVKGVEQLTENEKNDLEDALDGLGAVQVIPLVG